MLGTVNSAIVSRRTVQAILCRQSDVIQRVACSTDVAIVVTVKIS